MLLPFRPTVSLSSGTPGGRIGSYVSERNFVPILLRRTPKSYGIRSRRLMLLSVLYAFKMAECLCES